MRKVVLATLAALLAAGLFVPAQAAHEFGYFTFVEEIKDSSGNVRKMGEFMYRRELNTPTLDAPAEWIDGDRRGYRCGYAFLSYRGHIVGRTTYAYIKNPWTPRIIDRHMSEGVRQYDGTLWTGDPDQDPIDGSCDVFIDTENHSNPPPGDSPLVTFQHGPHAIEVRDFIATTNSGKDGSDLQSCCKNTPDPGHTFRLGAVTENRVEIIGYQDGVPVLQILYDLMAPGWTIPGTAHPVTLHTGCGLECGPPEPEPSPEPSPEPPPVVVLPSGTSELACPDGSAPSLDGVLATCP